MMSLRIKLLLPIFALFLATLVGGYLMLSRALDGTAIDFQKKNLNARIGSTIPPLPDVSIDDDEGLQALDRYFTLLRNIDPLVFRVQVWDPDLDVVYAQPWVLDRPDTETHAPLIRATFLRTAYNTWTKESPSLGDSDVFGQGEYLRGYIPIRDGDGEVRYVAAVDTSLGAVLAESRQSVLEITVFFATALFLLLVVGYGLVTHFLLRPVFSLNKAAMQIAHGDLGVVVVEESNDEMGSLAQAFNAMTKKMRELYEGFDQKVNEQTAAIARQLDENSKAKDAILHLLQDTRAMREKEKQQTQELQEAMLQVGKFARDADRERNTYHLILSSIGEGVVVLDMDRRVSVINTSAENFSGFEKTEVIGNEFHHFFRFLHDNEIPVEDVFWNEVYSPHVPTPTIQNVTLLGKGDRVVPVYFNVTRILDTRTGEMQGVILVFRDVTEERALEEARIGFISTASHQLRTPLTSMRWFSEMLLGGDAGDITLEQRHFIERIYQGIDRMIALVNLLLQLARVEAGRVKIEPVPVDLKATTEAVAAMLKVNLDAQKQEVTVVTDPVPLPVVPMDQDVIWQVIQNLLTNAQRYSREGGVISVMITQKDQQIEYVVKDTGIGIPEEQREHIFEKFFRADNAVTAVPEGSGLGLALVKTLVERWGGKIWFESEEGKGTTFFLTIPIKGMQAVEGEVKLRV